MKIKSKLMCVLPPGCLLAALLSPAPVRCDEIPEKYQAAAIKGLDYLAQAQGKDGRWEADGGKYPVAVTALCGLALRMEGSTAYRGNFAPSVYRAAEWLMCCCREERNWLIYSGHPSETDRYMEGHGLALQFLSFAFPDRPPASFEARFTGAFKYTVKAQTTQGGWNHTSKMEGHDLDDLLATVIQLESLSMTRFTFSRQSAKDGAGYVTRALESALTRQQAAGKKQKRFSTTEIAAALICLPSKNDLRVQWTDYCTREIPVGREAQTGRDALAHYYYAQAQYFEATGFGPSERWKSYRAALFDELLSRQNKDGSWPAASEGPFGSGSVLATALWCTVLQLDSNRHPLRQRGGFSGGGGGFGPGGSGFGTPGSGFGPGFAEPNPQRLLREKGGN